MARIPDDELERLKREVSVERLAEARGVKLARHGASTLSEPELIAILLRVGTQGANAIDVARQLLAEFKSLAGLARASVKELARIKGVGPTKAVQLAAGFELASRLARESTTRVPVETPAQVWSLLGESGLWCCAIRIAIEEVAFFKYLFESYEEVAVVRTAATDPDGTAVIAILAPPEFRDDAAAILDDVLERGAARATLVEMPAVCREDWFLTEWGEAAGAAADDPER